MVNLIKTEWVWKPQQHSAQIVHRIQTSNVRHSAGRPVLNPGRYL